ncbi:MAG TPA: hypothetical protein V6C76_10470 [Drouetiella sp.]
MGEFDLGKTATDSVGNAAKEVGGLVPRWVDEFVSGSMNSVGPESTSSRAAREFDLLHQGMAQGITKSINDAKENPGDLVFKAGVAAAIAAPACIILPRVLGGMPAYIALETLALGGTAAVVFDGAKNVASIGGAMQESWNNPQMFETHKNQIASASGPLVMDATACYLGTGLGLRFAQPVNKIGYEMERSIYHSFSSSRL